MDDFAPGPSVAIIGAGLSGLAAAIKLQDEGFNNFLIFDKGPEIGGTWRENRYPGCRSDVPIHCYTFSTDLRTHWTTACEGRPQIHEYIKDVVRTRHLDQHIWLNTFIIRADWIDSDQAYTIITEDVNTHERRTLKANIIISGTGILHIPRMPAVPGIESFQGEIFHSSKWDETMDLKGKRVAIIGNGSTGAGLMGVVPTIEGVKHVTHFYRTKNWCLPALQTGIPVPASLRWITTQLPFTARLHRWALYWINEFNYLLFFKGTWVKGWLNRTVADSMRHRAPAKYHEDLIPDFPVGTRRIVYDNGYLENLALPHVDLKRDAIAEIYPGGIITKDGEKLPFDVIVCATGFVVDRYPTDIRGKDGASVQEYYNQNEGPTAYKGTVMPGFPNFIMLVGPNTATGYASLVFFIECQLTYAAILMKPVLRGLISSFDVTKKATDEYNEKMHSKLENNFFKFGSSWYRNNKVGKNVVIFPGSSISFWRMLRTVDWSAYRVSGLKRGVTSLDNGNSTLGLVAGFGLALFAAMLKAVGVF